ncbi:lipid A export permease/ATP-binding protein MsbA [Thiomicrospira microaerophila]|uniref:lipid A export permease/ATP-binding protein MsbA n=1 Tax=Thiomicrospira microaerophila TaxID=406020 RepID=UPI00200D103F|nr:lipid A export permease/ATP-binding protein MsbA [Thiomicrospira microaerophila]UQB42950.1 lipid A export permease/ATP-binding protein MsbA [Thiomicrospira microaerophila]
MPSTSNALVKTWPLYKRLLGYIRPYKAMIAVTILALLVIAITEPAMAAILKELVDKSMIEQDPDSFILLPLMLVGIFFIKGVGEYVSKVSSQWIAERAILNIRNDMYQKMQYLPMQEFSRYSVGQLMSKITYDVQQTSNALSQAWIVLIRDSLILIALLAYMLYISIYLTLFMLIVGPILGLIIRQASKKMRKHSRSMQGNMGQMTHCLEEGLVGHKEIKIYNAENYEQQRFNHSAEQLFKNTMRVTRVSALNSPLVLFIGSIALAGVIFVAMKLSSFQQLTPGELLSYITAMALTFAPLKRLTNINIIVQKGMAAAESIFALLDSPIEENQGQLKPKIKGKIQFKSVNFSYPNSSHPALQNFNLTFPANQTTALVGHSGSGKSTLVNLIARFYPIEQGQILIDNYEISQLDLAYLRSKIGFVSQQVVLFNDTIRANIAYGHQEFNEQAIIDAAKSAHAWEFIEKLPEGLNTQVGENGANLSGGQRQRIALARAFLKNAPILILDEATSALDNQSEALIQQAMDKLRQNRTVIIIAHRLTTIESADQIAVIDQGELVELGNHADLMSLNGYYARLHQQGDGHESA